MCVNIGHGDERVLTAIGEQSEKPTYARRHLVAELRARLHQLPAQASPGALRLSFLTLSGAEASEYAVRSVHLVTRRQKILVRSRSCHGAPAGAVSLTGEPRCWRVDPGIPGVAWAMDPYRYRCRRCQEQPACNLNCLNHVGSVIRSEGAYTLAAVLMEAVGGTNGITAPPDGYLQGRRTSCDTYGLLLVAYEVMSRFGRTGEWFAAGWDGVPDMTTPAKGLTSAHLPLGAIMVNDESAAHFEDNFRYSGLTHGPRPVSRAAAFATIKVCREDGLVEHAKKMGTVLAHEMERLRHKHLSIGETRPTGLFVLFELVRNRQTREPMAPFHVTADGADDSTRCVFRANGLFGPVRWNTFFANPPLCIREEALREELVMVDHALDIHVAAPRPEKSSWEWARMNTKSPVPIGPECKMRISWEH